MSTLYDRIKKVRKSNNLTQQKFGERLGLKQNTIATYEMGKTEPSDRTISDICREFGVNEEWLRYGTGKMPSNASREKEIETLMRSSLRGSEEFKEAVIQAVKSRSEKELEVLEKMLWDIVYNLQDAKKAQADSQPGHKIMKIAGRDGSLEEQLLTDEDANEYLNRIDQLPDAGEDL